MPERVTACLQNVASRLRKQEVCLKEYMVFFTFTQVGLHLSIRGGLTFSLCVMTAGVLATYI